jgi:hypothetical protein
MLKRFVPGGEKNCFSLNTKSEKFLCLQINKFKYKEHMLYTTLKLRVSMLCHNDSNIMSYKIIFCQNSTHMTKDFITTTVVVGTRRKLSCRETFTELNILPLTNKYLLPVCCGQRGKLLIKFRYKQHRYKT